VHADTAGIYEPFVDLDDRVEKGEPIGQIHRPNAPGKPATVYRAPASGVIYNRHAFGLIERGQTVALVAAETQDL
jgi:predicted deacylase